MSTSAWRKVTTTRYCTRTQVVVQQAHLKQRSRLRSVNEISGSDVHGQVLAEQARDDVVVDCGNLMRAQLRDVNVDVIW